MTALSAREQHLRPYVPRLVVDWGRHHHDERFRVMPGTLLSADISGFTALSERLAVLGKAGAEELTDLLNHCFDGMIAASARYGGDVLKFGGDALLIFFSGPDHAVRAAASAVAMRSVISQPLSTSRAGRVRLKMSQGIHSDDFTFVLLDGAHRELVVTGPAATATVECEAAAGAGEILMSPGAAALVDPTWLGASRDQNRLLRRRSIELDPWIDLEPDDANTEELERYVPVAQRAQIAAQVGGEHRQVTVAFVKFSHTDTVIEHGGLAELTSRLQELADVVERAAEAHGAHWLAGDVYPDGGKFILTAGVPSSSGHDEDDMLHTLREVLDAGVDLDLRIGVHRGHVFAGDLGGSSRRTFTVMGDAVNLAARLMQKSDSGQLIASDDVLERVGARVIAVPLEPFLVKGKKHPVRAAAVGQVRAAQRRGRDAALPFVGRTKELSTLDAALAAARRDQGFAVELVGEPGIGKSRLVAEFLRRNTLEYVGTMMGGQYLRATPYLVVRPLLRELLGINEEATPGDAGRELTAWVEVHAPALMPWLPLLAIPFDAEVSETPESNRIAPEFRRARLERALLELLDSAVPAHPVLIVEDAHLLDDATRDLLVELVGEGGSSSWLVVLARRPGAAVLPPTARAVELPLEPLPSAETVALATSAAADREVLSPADLSALSARSHGNPLFVLELIESAATRESTEALPETIEALMTSRIDTLAPADRRLLRDASVLGAIVDTVVLAEALDDDEIGVGSRWSALDPFLAWDGDVLRFRHGLFREVAYEGLSYRRRAQVHRAVGDVLERRNPDVRPIAGLLSTHFDRSSDHARACRYSLVAGEDAKAKYANVEAAEFLRRFVENAPHAALPELEVARVAEALGDVTELLGRYDESDRAYVIALRRTTDAVVTARLLHKQGLLQERAGKYRDALRWFGRALKVADADSPEQAGNRVELALAYGGVRYRQGRYAETVRWTEVAADAAERLSDRKALAHALDLRDLALIFWSDGNPDRQVGRALGIYEELGDLVGQSSALNNIGIAEYQAGRWDRAKELYARSRIASEQAGDVNGAATSLFNLGEILHDQGLVDEARQALTDARAVWRSAHYPIGVAVTTLHLGRTEMRAGNYDTALRLLDEAVDQCEAIQAASFVLDARVRRIECLVEIGRPSDALGLADEVHRTLDREGSDPLLWIALQRARGKARFALDDADALELLDDAVTNAERAEAPYELAETLRVRAVVREASGDTEGMAADRERARAIFTELGVSDR